MTITAMLINVPPHRHTKQCWIDDYGADAWKNMVSLCGLYSDAAYMMMAESYFDDFEAMRLIRRAPYSTEITVV